MSKRRHTLGFFNRLLLAISGPKSRYPKPSTSKHRANIINTFMRYYELFETFLGEADKQMMGIYNPALDTLRQNHLGDTNKPRITLKHLNKIKRQRRIHKIANDKKLAMLPLQYSNDRDQQAEETKMDLEKQAFELEMAKERMTLEQERIALDIEKASISADDKEAIAAKALKSVNRRLKS